MCSSHIYTCLRVTSYNLSQNSYESGSPTNLLPCKNIFLAQADKDGRKDGTAAQESWEQLRQSCTKVSKLLCVKFQLMLPGPSSLFPLQDRTVQALLPPFLLYPHFPLPIPGHCLLLQLLVSLQCTTEQRNSSYW